LVQRQCFERRYEWLSSSDRVVPRGQPARSGSHRTFSSLSCRGGRFLSLSNRTSPAKRSRVVETRKLTDLGSTTRFPAEISRGAVLCFALRGASPGAWPIRPGAFFIPVRFTVEKTTGVFHFPGYVHAPRHTGWLRRPGRPPGAKTTSETEREG